MSSFFETVSDKNDDLENTYESLAPLNDVARSRYYICNLDNVKLKPGLPTLEKGRGLLIELLHLFILCLIPPMWMMLLHHIVK